MNYTEKVGVVYVKYTTIKLIFKTKGMNVTNIRVMMISSGGEGVNRKQISGTLAMFYFLTSFYKHCLKIICKLYIRAICIFSIYDIFYN